MTISQEPPPSVLDMHQRMKHLSQGHVDSMNSLYANLTELAQLCRPALLRMDNRIAEVRVVDLHLEPPTSANNASKRIFPAECRMGSLSYTGQLTADILIRFYDVDPETENRTLIRQYITKNVDAGHIPIMVGTTKCNTYNLNPHELAALGEEFYEFGGYFLMNGNERVCRMSIAQKRNMPLVMRRSIKSHDKLSPNKVCIRSVRSCYQIIQWLLLDPVGGKLILRIAIRGDYHIDFFLILKALFNATEKQLCDLLVGDREENPTLFEMFQFLLRNRSPEDRLMSHHEARVQIGSRFCQEQSEDPLEACKTFLDNFLLIHLDNDVDKFNALIFACRRLLLLHVGQIEPDDPDSFHLHEVTTPAIVFGTLIQNTVSVSLKMASNFASKTLRNLEKRSKRAKKVGENAASEESQEPNDNTVHSPKVWNLALARCMGNVGPSICTAVATGNFPVTFLEKVWLNAFAGIFITATRINMLQFMSHFRVAHRGQQFAEGKLLEPRRLKTSAWGFICPVHTPDGTLCGLVNHITSSTEISHRCDESLVKNLPRVCRELGMLEDSAPPLVPVLIEGATLGGIPREKADEFVRQLRVRKIQGTEIPSSIEIGYHKYSRFDKKQYPYIFLSISDCRFVRPVTYLPLGQIEYITPLEQAHLHICLDKNSFIKGKTTHQESSKTNILSVLGNLTPFSEHNQSPRNIYECGMAKQSIAHPMFSADFRSDTKLFKLETPQRPIARTFMQSEIAVDDYAIGTNAIVAVVAQTGHDMEDGMIMCKDSMQRGFAYASVYATEKLSMPLDGSFITRVDPNTNLDHEYDTVDSLGLPRVGTFIQKGDVWYSKYNGDRGTVQGVAWREDKTVIIDRVTTVSGEVVRGKEGNLQNVKSNIMTRLPVPPNIGDKFASRHGQKGICSLLVPQTDMPFSGSGIVPDIIINPNAFPSRMTIGMLIESMAGKSGAVHGTMSDASTFGTSEGFDETHTPVAHFGKQLAHAGYNYFGSEILHDGTTGEEMKAEIFIGIVYYQRLKHMVIDKYQSRADMGPVDQKTRQPIKGRARGGGIRFGEMERDALLSHGTSGVLRDRLFHCSDESTAWTCKRCGRFFSVNVYGDASGKDLMTRTVPRVVCASCQSDRFVELVHIPAVFTYLVKELAGLGIDLALRD